MEKNLAALLEKFTCAPMCRPCCCSLDDQSIVELNWESGDGTASALPSQYPDEQAFKSMGYEDDEDLPGETTLEESAGGEDVAQQGIGPRMPSKIFEGGKYKGEWQGEKWHGYGLLWQWRDGSTYEGNFSDGKANGAGKFLASTGAEYEGQWLDDKAHGRGWYKHEDGATYEGEWLQDQKHGQGVEIWPDGCMYEGSFVEGCKHGHGVYTTDRLRYGDCCYTGQFERDAMHGVGSYRFSDRRLYEGQWMEGRINGEGTMTWPDGSKYVGQFKDDVRAGEGTLRWSDGRSYRGQWSDGKQDGEGVMIQADGTERKGTFRAGVQVRS